MNIKTIVSAICGIFCMFSVQAVQDIKKQQLVLQSANWSPQMLELYTSQGCSSCPPAERWLNQLTQHPKLWTEIVPINFHVDYWDYLGWPDPYADARFSRRQRLYRSIGLTPNVATPGFVIDGKGWNGWFYRQKMPAIQKREVGTLTIRNTDSAEQLVAVFKPKHHFSKGLELNWVQLGFDISTHVKTGENYGQKLQHEFVVLNYQRQLMNKKQGYRLRFSPHFQHSEQQTAQVFWVAEPSNPSPIQVVAGWIPKLPN